MLLLSSVFAQQKEISLLEPELRTDLPENSTCIQIRSNRKKAKIYLNGEFAGVTPLTVKNLVEGRYILKIQFEEIQKNFLIDVKKAFKLNYYIELTENITSNEKKQNNSKQYKIQHGPLANQIKN